MEVGDQLFGPTNHCPTQVARCRHQQTRRLLSVKSAESSSHPRVCFCKIRFDVPSAAWSYKRCLPFQFSDRYFVAHSPPLRSWLLRTLKMCSWLRHSLQPWEGRKYFFGEAPPPPSPCLLVFRYFRNILWISLRAVGVYTDTMRPACVSGANADCWR